MKKFALLHHEMPAGAPTPSHWDLLFEQACARGNDESNCLFALRLLEFPKLEVKAGEVSTKAVGRISTSDSPPGPLVAFQQIRAERLVDHRRHYLTYEGPISRDRGVVRRVAQGTYRMSAGADRPNVSDLHGGGRIELLTNEYRASAIFDVPPLAVHQRANIAIFRWEITDSRHE